MLHKTVGEITGFLGDPDLGKIRGHALKFRGEQEAGQFAEHRIRAEAGDRLRPCELAVAHDRACGLALLGPQREDGAGVRA